jgi:group II intron reverse transcriptase/maturase
MVETTGNRKMQIHTTDKPFNITKKQVYEAYKAVKSNAGSAGVDGQTIEQFDSDLRNNLYKLWNRMSSGSYFPPPVRAVSIPKKTGGQRILGVPTVADRVAQMVVKQLIEPDLDPIFLADSYGYRPRKSAHDAIGVTRKRCWKYDWVLEFDIKGLFDNIDHELLLRAVRRHVTCKWALLYIERWLTAPMEQADGLKAERTRGTPQGGVVAPRTQKVTLRSRQCGVRTAGWRAVTRCHGQRDAVPDDDLVVADENFLDEKPQDALAFQYVEGPRRRPQSRKERGQRFSEAQVGCAVD